MKEINTYRCEVDLYRNGAIFREKNTKLYNRSTEGVYYVGAKSETEAKDLLQMAIKFGKINVSLDKYHGCDKALGYKEIIRRDGEPVLPATICNLAKLNYREEEEKNKEYGESERD